MRNLSVTLNGTRLGRSALPLTTQEYLRELESDVVALESQLWQLVERRPAQRPRYCQQWREMRDRLELEAQKQTGLTVTIETPAWVLLSEPEKVEASAQMGTQRTEGT